MNTLAALDRFDLVALLLGALGAFVVLQSPLVRRADAGPFNRALLFVGLGLILSYLASEIFHALQRQVG